MGWGGGDLTFVKRCGTPINQSIQAWRIRACCSLFPTMWRLNSNRAPQTLLPLLLISFHITLSGYSNINFRYFFSCCYYVSIAFIFFDILGGLFWINKAAYTLSKWKYHHFPFPFPCAACLMPETEFPISFFSSFSSSTFHFSLFALQAFLSFLSLNHSGSQPH